MASEIVPIHIQLKKGAVSKRVIVAGDPSRIEAISKFLDNPKILNKYRYLVYTGQYKGKEITLASHGIGAPSIAIAIEELYALGGEMFIRLGTCGGVQKDQKYGSLIIPSSAFSSGGGTIGAYVKDSKEAFEPDHDISNKLIETAKKNGKNYFVGPVFSSDAFYKENEEVSKKRDKIVGVEMECATLFMLGKLKKFKTASLLMVVDNQLENVPFLSIDEMHRLAEEAAIIVLDTLVA
jgi:5'-methylthioadenosine phosphorylase